MWIKSKRFLLLSGLFLLSLSVRSISYSYADVILTDKEAQEKRAKSEIQESKKDLTELKNQLNEAETQLQDVKSTYEEQKKSYEMQLKEEKKKSTEAKIFAGSASASTLVISIALLIVLL